MSHLTLEIDYLRGDLAKRDAEIETLRELLVRVLIVEGRCPTQLLTEIKAALARKEVSHEPE